MATSGPDVEESDVVVEWRPNAVHIYKNKVADLQAALTADDLAREQATAPLRGLVEKIIAFPVGNPRTVRSRTSWASRGRQNLAILAVQAVFCEPVSVHFPC